jgi:hypothetical protein
MDTIGTLESYLLAITGLSDALRPIIMRAETETQGVATSVPLDFNLSRG